MLLFPYEKYTISTQLSPQDVIRCIRSSIYIRNGYKKEDFVQPAGKYFTGYILNNKFELQQNIRIIRGGKLPDIKGEVIVVNEVTKVHIKISSSSATLFTNLIIGSLILVAIIMLLKADYRYYLASVVAILGYLLDLIIFKIMSKRITRILLDILNGDIKYD